MRLRHTDIVIRLMWALLIVAGVTALVTANVSLFFVSVATLALTSVPYLFQSWAGVRFPAGFVVAVVFFIVATVFLGEAGDFYERFWWWDVMLHGGSAVGFGMMGVILALLLAGSDRIAPTPSLVAFFAFSFAVAVGALWEIFEFAMDQIFGMNMQKSGLMDTMGDLIVDVIGGAVGALAGFGYLKGRQSGVLSGAIADFITQNRHLFGRRDK